MPNWSSPEEIQRNSVVFIKLQHALLGLYGWEFFLSLDFDWQFISGKKKFRWPLVFYFLGRYLLLFALIGIAIALDTTTPINCQALYTFDQLAGDAAVGLASINLSLRTIAVWRQNKVIIILLVLIIMGHWSLILQGVLLTAHWDPVMRTCVIDSTNNTILAATFIYSMAFDFIVLVLSGYRLIGLSTTVEPSTSSGIGRLKTNISTGSRLGRMIFKDGLIYFFIAFVANLLATVFMVINLNPIMSVIFNVPAAVASTIVASRVVRRLTNFANTGAEVYNESSNHTSNIQFRSRGAGGATSPGAVGVASVKARRNTKTGGVHVQMDTFSRADDEASRSASGGEDDSVRKPQVVFVNAKDGDVEGSDKETDADVEKGQL